MSAAARALAVLEHLAVSGQPVASRDLSAALGIPKSTLSDLLAELRSLGYVQIVQSRYVAGPAMLSFAYRTAQRIGTLEGIVSSLERLADETGETVLYSVEVGGDAGTPGQILIVDQVVSPNPVRYVAPVGHPLDLHDTAAGRVLLAFTQRTAPHGSGVSTEMLEEVRARGYAVREASSGATSIAAPVYDREGVLVGAISVTGPTPRMGDASERIWPALRQAVEALAPARL